MVALTRHNVTLYVQYIARLVKLHVFNYLLQYYCIVKL